MTRRPEKAIHLAYMRGLFEGKKQILDELAMLMDDQMDELRKQMEAQK